jgi:Type II CAAX prenyl endopeptidase Rce1-like
MSWRLVLVAWVAGLPGVVVVALFILPALAVGHQLPIPLWAVQLASGAQSALLLAIAAAVGAWLANRVDLTAPALSAIAESRSVIEALRPQLGPGSLGGMLGGMLLWLFACYSPEALAQLQAELRMPLAAGLLYGGLTEELLLRWGLMTLVAWLLWRTWQGGVGTPSRSVMWAAIGVSAFFFGLGHLPALSAALGHLSERLVIYVVSANAVFGVMAGFLLAPGGVGLVRSGDGALPTAAGADHSFLGGAARMARVTFGKSRVRESRMLGSEGEA